MRIVPGSHPPDPAPVRTLGPAPELRDQLTTAMPRRVRELLEHPESGEVRIGNRSFGATIADALRFRFVGSGTLATRTIMGENTAATNLLASAKGPAVRDAIAGLLQVFGDRGQRMRMTGLTMSANTDALLGNLLVSTAEEAFNGDEDFTPDDLSSIARELEDAGLDQAYGVYDGAGWMHLDPSTSREFHERVAAGPGAPIKRGELIATLQHELEHSVTPSSNAEYAKVQWLEEASAELLTQWNGAIGDLADGMGIRQESSGVVAYQPPVRELQKWVRRAGLDPARREDLAPARALLQDESVGRVPRRLAEAIVAHERTGDVSKLESTIAKAFGPSSFADAEQGVAGSGGSSPDQLDELMSGGIGLGSGGLGGGLGGFAVRLQPLVARMR